MVTEENLKILFEWITVWENPDFEKKEIKKTKVNEITKDQWIIIADHSWHLTDLAFATGKN